MSHVVLAIAKGPFAVFPRLAPGYGRQTNMESGRVWFYALRPARPLFQLVMHWRVVINTSTTWQSWKTDRKSTRLNSSHSLRDALPIYGIRTRLVLRVAASAPVVPARDALARSDKHQHHLAILENRSEEHTSELQSLPTRRSSDLWNPDASGFTRCGQRARCSSS